VAEILDGRVAAGKLKDEVGRRVGVLERSGISPQLVMLRVGEDPASRVYVRAKEKACSRVGIRSRVILLAEETRREELRQQIESLNADTAVHGILLQLPLPGDLPEDEMLSAIDPGKDVDGFHPLNVGCLCLGLPAFIPATPLGIMRLLEHYAIPIAGRRVVVLGRSRIVGRPLANLLSSRGVHGNATVTICHTRTADLGAVTREAEILIAAAGRKRLVTAEMVSPGAVVVDVGIHREPDADRPGKMKLCGDVDFARVKERARAITPVPGGVGPMTVAALLENTVRAAQLQAGLPEFVPSGEQTQGGA
jgi:methylenetetrahydrofolate dehydrogenase (NADP+)/methenyltetrahydrofolate cyclohydrolase